MTLRARVGAISDRTSLPLAVVALGMTSFFNDLASEMIFPLLPAFVAMLGAGPTFLGLIEGAADAISSLLKLASGYAAERRGSTKPLVVLGYGIASIARPLMGLATAPWHVLAIRLGDRVGKGLRSAPRDALIARVARDGGAGRAFGFHRALDHAGAVVGPLVATALLAAGVPLRNVFLLAVIPGLLSLAVLLLVREPEAPTPETAPPRSTNGERATLPRELRAFLGVLTLSSLANSSDAFLLLRARELGVPQELLPMLWSLLHVSKMASSYLAGDASDRSSRTRAIAAGWGVFALCYGALAAATQPWQAWAVFCIYGAHHGLTEPTERAVIRDLTPAALHGRAFGYYNFIAGIMAIPAGYLTGVLWEGYGASTALAGPAVLAIVCAIVFGTWERHHGFVQRVR